MTRSFLLFPMMLVLTVGLALFSCGGTPAHAAGFGDALRGQDWSLLLLPAALVVLGLGGKVLHLLAGYLRQRQEDSRLARVLDTMGSQADGIAEDLRTHPPAAPEVLHAVRQAGVALAVSYVTRVYPAWLPLLNFGTDALATRLDRMVSDRMNTAALSVVPVILPVAAPAAVPDSVPAPAAAA